MIGHGRSVRAVAYGTGEVETVNMVDVNAAGADGNAAALLDISVAHSVTLIRLVIANH